MLWMVVVGFFQEKCSPVARILKCTEPVGMIWKGRVMNRNKLGEIWRKEPLQTIN